jgi:glucose 1-dehydrogenase
MRAVVVTPGKKNSARLVEMGDPTLSDTQVCVKVIRVGICGTDAEIDRAEYGKAPSGESKLILGHESFGVVEAVGHRVKGFKKGDYVGSLVRRPDNCSYCRTGSQDMCVEQEYTERGIKGQHGFLSEYYVEHPEFLVKLPPELHEVGVLLEPLTVVEKGIRHAWIMQKRMQGWEPKRALVLGAGPIGFMAALLLRIQGIETTVFARSCNRFREERLEQIGAHYCSQFNDGREKKIEIKDLPSRFGPFDFVIEATGSAQVAISAMHLVAVNGIVCLTSVTGSDENFEISGARLNYDMVLGNRTVFGTVNASRVDFEKGVEHLVEAEQRWPGWLESLITRRVKPERFREALERRADDVKVVVEFASAIE